VYSFGALESGHKHLFVRYVHDGLWSAMFLFNKSLFSHTATAHHPETWNSNWNLRTLVLSMRGFMVTSPLEIGGIATDSATQQRLAIASRVWICKECNTNHHFLLHNEPNNKTLTNPKIINASNLATLDSIQKKRKKRNVNITKKSSKLKNSLLFFLHKGSVKLISLIWIFWLISTLFR
jgi:hypothetical protein